MTGDPIAVEHEEFTFRCPSDEYGQPPYLVDLEAHNGEGECPCLNFDIVRRTRRNEGDDNPDRTSCKHCKRAFIKWAEIQDPRMTLKPRREVLKWARAEVKRIVMRKRRLERKARNAGKP